MPAARPARAGRTALAAAALLLLGAAGGARGRVLLLGDSITAGAVSGPSSRLLSGANGPGYASRLADALGPRVLVKNVGAGGTTSTSWLGQIESPEGASVSGDLVVVLLGTNDALWPPGHPPTERARFAANLRAIASGLGRGFGVVMLLTPPPAPAANPNASPEWTARLSGYREEVLLACAELERVVCGPDLFTLLDPRGDFHEGNIHPNAAGHAKIAAALAEALRPLLDDRVEEHR